MASRLKKFSCKSESSLAMSAVTASMEPASAAQTALIAAGASAKFAAMLKAFMGEPAASKTVMIPAATGKAAPIKPAAIVTTTVEVSAIEAGMTPIPVVPRPYTDEYAVHKPLRPVVAVGRAGVRSIVIIAVGANGRWSYISRARADADTKIHPLSARKGGAKEANAK